MPYKDAAKQRQANKKYDAKRAGTRHRAWTAVLYPDSCEEDWRDILADQCIEALVSPLHDSDVEPTGELKKPHYHVVLSFPNAVTYKAATDVFDLIGAVVPPPMHCAVKDFRQMARYLCHLDQPNKHQYSTSDVTVFGGIDYETLILSAADQDALIDEMCDFIDSNHIFSFAEFCRIVRRQKPEWKNTLYHHCSYVVREYIRSCAWETRQQTLLVDVETGEILR